MSDQEHSEYLRGQADMLAFVMQVVRQAPRADSATGFDLIHREDVIRKLPR